MPTATLPAAARLLAAAQALTPTIRHHAAAAERERRLPVALVTALRDAGLFRMFLPTALGGEALDPVTVARVVETLAHADGAVGWCVMVAAQCAVYTAALDEVGAAALRSPDLILAGAGGRGCAVVTPEGYRVTGRWPFASGVGHATWFLVAGCPVYDGDTPRRRADGSSEAVTLFLPATAVEVVDTWDTTGLRGTGSHDVTATAVAVPPHLAYPAATAPRQPGPQFRGGVFWRAFRGGVALGIARHALDALAELAATKKPAFSAEVLRDLPRAQAEVAAAEALVDGARTYFYDALEALWAAAQTDDDPPLPLRARARLATVHAMHQSAEAVDRLYHLGGGTAIYATSALDRCFRDLNTARADSQVAPRVYEAVGRVYLGLEPPAGML